MLSFVWFCPPRSLLPPLPAGAAAGGRQKSSVGGLGGVTEKKKGSQPGTHTNSSELLGSQPQLQAPIPGKHTEKKKERKGKAGSIPRSAVSWEKPELVQTIEGCCFFFFVFDEMRSLLSLKHSPGTLRGFGCTCGFLRHFTVPGFQSHWFSRMKYSTSASCFVL